MKMTRPTSEHDNVKDPGVEMPDASVHESATPEFESYADGSVRIRLDLIFTEGTFFPRASLDRDTIEKYTFDLIRGDKFEPITVESTKDGFYNVLKGFHRFEAYCLRKKIYSGEVHGDFYDEPLPSISDTELNAILCFVITIPKDTDPMILVMKDNLKHGKPYTSADYEKIARYLYDKNVGASVKELSLQIPISAKVFKKHVADLVEGFEKEKEELIIRFHDQGFSLNEISKKLKELFPKAKGLGKSQIAEFLVNLRKQKDLLEEGSDTGQQQVENASGTEETVAPLTDTRSDQIGNPVEFRAIFGNTTDTIVILGLASLLPHLQEEVRTEINKLVERIKEKTGLALEEAGRFGKP